MMKLNDKNFHRALKSQRLVVMFYAAWAGPCNLVRPTYDEASEGLKDKAVFAEFDVDDNPTIPETYGVRALPTFILFEGGVPVTVKAGAIPAEAIKEMVDPPAPTKGKKAKR